MRRAPDRATVLSRVVLFLAAVALLDAAPDAQFEVAPILSDKATTPASAEMGDVDGDGDVDVVYGTEHAEVYWLENLDGKGIAYARHRVGNESNKVHGVFLGDADGDADLDVFVASLGLDTLEWYPNLDGLGGFGPKQPIAAGVDTTSVAAADLDGDGDLDVMSNSTSGEIWWQENLDGSGTYGARNILATGTINSRMIQAVDVDGDGDLDLLAPGGGASTVLWFENTDGAGTFSAGLVIASSGAWIHRSFASDLDGDGDVDVSFGARLSWCENTDGAGTFGMPKTIDASGGGFVLGGGDLDSDGDQDLVASRSVGTNVGWYENLDGLASAFGTHDLTDFELGTEIDSSDIDGDGDLDLLVTSSINKLVQLSVNANGGFGHGYTLAAPYYAPEEMLGGDFDGDGDVDLLYSFNDNDSFESFQAIAWSENLSPLGFARPTILPFYATPTQALAAGDLDGDGDLDVVRAGHEQDPWGTNASVQWSENLDGDGNFGGFEVVSNDSGFYNDVLTADLDGDGDVDVSASHPAEVFWEANTDGLGDFGLPDKFVGNPAGGSQGIHAEDVDGDGDVDLLAIHLSSVTWYENSDGAGTFVDAGVLASLGSDTAASLTTADVDGDGDHDVLAGASTRVFSFENLDGLGTYGPGVVTVTPFAGSTLLHAADLEGDGDLDVLTAAGDMGWLINDGAGVFSVQLPVAAGSSVRGAYPADADGDGDLDVAWGDAEVVAWSENLLCPTVVPSAEVVRLGSPPNPDALKPGLTSGPVLGSTWDPSLDHTSFLPGAIFDALAITKLGANVVTSFGTLLCNVSQPTVTIPGSVGLAFSIEVPTDCALAGTTLCAQAVSFDGAQVRLTNALDLVLGSF